VRVPVCSALMMGVRRGRLLRGHATTDVRSAADGSVALAISHASRCPLKDPGLPDDAR